MKKLKLPTMLSYRRSIQPTIGFMYSSDGKEDFPIEVHRETVTGFQGHHGASVKLENGCGTAMSNVQTQDSAHMRFDTEILKVKFSLAILPESLMATTCNDQAVDEALQLFNILYVEKEEGKILAKCYVENVITGRWLWRNDCGMSKTIKVTLIDDGTEQEFLFAGKRKKYTVQSLTSLTDISVEESYKILIDAVHKGLFDEESNIHLTVEGQIKLLEGSQVHPSGEINRDNVKGYSNRLSSVNRNGIRQAVVHSRKIGNAIRTIDTWYEDDATIPLPIEPFGNEKRTYLAHRAKRDTYTCIQNRLLTWNESLKKCSSIGDLDDANDIHYFMACLIRGGVFSGMKSK